MPLHAAPRRESLVSQVTEQLLAQINSGEWPVGSRIPTEPELVRALGVGRNTVREAVRGLIHAGLLERRQGSGTYVLSDTELAGAVARRLADARIAEAAEVRRAFEVEAARLAALRRTDADLAALDGALAAREAAWAGGDAEAFVEADAILHTAIVLAAHNSILADFYTDFGAALRGALADAIGDDLSPESWVDHTRLIEAIRAGDPAAAATEAARFLATADGTGAAVSATGAGSDPAGAHADPAPAGARPDPASA